MKPVRLASIAFQAERVRLRHMARRIAAQVAMLVVAAVLVMTAVLIGHAALFELLAQRLPPAGAYGVLAGGDVLVALILAWIGSSSSPGEDEREAEQLSLSAREGIRSAFSWTKILFWAFTMFRARR